jgi:Kef-type K+ transport system membrane component KefB
MNADIIPLVIATAVLLSSLISLRIGISVAIIEIIIGVLIGNLGIKTEEWMLYLSNFGGIILTYLAGTEIDTKLFKEKFKESFLIGMFSFLAPFFGVFLYTYYIANWEFNASLIAGTALSTTSLAVVYSVLVESNLSKTNIGKIIMASTFVTDMGTALALSIMFIKPSFYTLIFLLISTVLILFVYRFSLYLLRNKLMANKVIEPEIKLIFLVLIIFIYFAKLGDGHAVLPAFILGLLMSKHFKEERKTIIIRNKLRTVAYAMVTPIFFIVGGMKISVPMILTALGIFLILFVVKILMKFIGVYFLAKKYIPKNCIYTTLLMSTGLTFGTISSLFGLQAGYINQIQYSILVGVVVASAVIPTFVAQKWFMPLHEEDVVEELNGKE